MIPFFNPKILYPFTYSKQVMNEILQSAQETFSLDASLDIILLLVGERLIIKISIL
ncbi:hypothetical protein A5819_000620 [Enterococcus sp. 7E2_DIV0204]|nr:hypothetical protein A5819_000620 [Enterococcus sp. 7E2_DIV0204]OTP49153.1 hypothetical protein A5884_002347 [Enterococcus sp. 7D2_DIV0200]